MRMGVAHGHTCESRSIQTPARSMISVHRPFYVHLNAYVHTPVTSPGRIDNRARLTGHGNYLEGNAC
jgi:hypothetical protein